MANDDFTRLMKAMPSLANANIYLDEEPAQTIGKIRAKAQRMARQYGIKTGDFQLVESWAKGHGSEFIETVLPPLGIIVERGGAPVAAIWCYLSVGIGVGFIEWPVTKPGQSLRQSREAILFGIDAIMTAGRANDYGLFRLCTMPGAARVLERAGWARDASGERIPMSKLIS